MNVFGNGFVAYHIDVHVEQGSLDSVKSTIKGWQSDFRRRGNWPGFPGTLIRALTQTTGVTRVEMEGPQSSVLIPLRMVHGMTGAPCTLSSVLGSGAIATAIADCCRMWCIELKESKRLTDGDSPLEFSLREPDGRHDSVRLYSVSRANFRNTLQISAPPPDHLLLNRCNQGLKALAQTTYAKGGIVSLRIRVFGRYDSIDDYLPLFRVTNQLVLSTRHGVLRAFARQCGISLPRRWPTVGHALSDTRGRCIAQWLLDHMPKSSVVVFNVYKQNATAFYREGYEPVVVPPPVEAGAASRTARIQGALLGGCLLKAQCHAGADAQAAWRQFCEFVVAYAFQGTQQHPWRYPQQGVFVD